MSNIQEIKKIEELAKVLSDHINSEGQDVSSLLKEFRDFREEAKPMLELYHNSKGFFITFIWILKLAALIGAGVGAIIFLKKL